MCSPNTHTVRPKRKLKKLVVVSNSSVYILHTTKSHLEQTLLVAKAKYESAEYAVEESAADETRSVSL